MCVCLSISVSDCVCVGVCVFACVCVYMCGCLCVRLSCVYTKYEMLRMTHTRRESACPRLSINLYLTVRSLPTLLYLYQWTVHVLVCVATPYLHVQVQLYVPSKRMSWVSNRRAILRNRCSLTMPRMQALPPGSWNAFPFASLPTDKTAQATQRM